MILGLAIYADERIVDEAWVLSSLGALMGPSCVTSARFFFVDRLVLLQKLNHYGVVGGPLKLAVLLAG